MRSACLFVLNWTALITGISGAPQTCQPCHSAQVTAQVRSRHALALRPITGTPLPGMLANEVLAERSGIRFTYKAAPEGVLVEATQGQGSAAALLLWAFGSGAQAWTPVGLINNRWFEHRISWYVAAGGGRRTLGHPGEASKDPGAALGIPQDPETIFRCFNCHATGVRLGPDLRAMTPGISCERCHGSTAEHTARHASMQPLSKAGRDRVMELCGECHRLPASGSKAPERDDPLSIRFAPVGLMASACYRSSRNLSCVTCHNPHTDASSEADHYIAVCRTCHQQRSQACVAQGGSNCIACHMAQRSPAPYLTFTDHRIRVYQTGVEVRR